MSVGGVYVLMASRHHGMAGSAVPRFGRVCVVPDGDADGVARRVGARDTATSTSRRSPSRGNLASVPLALT